MLQSPNMSRGILARIVLGALFVILTILFESQVRPGSNLVTAASYEPSEWTFALPRDICYASEEDDCHRGSPGLADVTGDGFDDIIVVTNNGHIIALDHLGNLLWDTDVAPYFGMAAGQHEIHSSPAIADIDGDGYPEIAVGVGTIDPEICTVGGFIVLDQLGKPEPGWPIIGFDNDTLPAGCPDSIFSSPAVGDMDNDGDLEIFVASFDKRIYGWHHDGSPLPGYPPSSNLALRFPTWEDLKGKLADLSWGSPSLADLDNDGYLDMVIATGEGNFDDRYGGDSGGWYCPYTPPAGWSPGYCGGSIYAFNRFGDVMPGFPRYFLEAFGSTPAVADTNGDGSIEIYVGTSNFYHRHSPDHPTYGFKLFGLDALGNDLPGWEGGKDLGGTSPASPSIGDIAGDGNLEIVIAANDRKLYAFHSDGSIVGGFPMTPLTETGKAYLDYGHGVSFPLADYDADGKMEIFINQTWNVVVVDGNGQQLTSSNFPVDGRPVYMAGGNLFNTPAVGDIDQDGRLELIVSNSEVTVWDLPNSDDYSHWPLFKCNAARTGHQCQPRITLFPTEVMITQATGEDGEIVYPMHLEYSGKETISWHADAPDNIKLFPASGKLKRNQSAEIIVSIITEDLQTGVHDLGSVQVTATGDGINLPALQHDISVFVGVGYRKYFPVTFR